MEFDQTVDAPVKVKQATAGLDKLIRRRFARTRLSRGRSATDKVEQAAAGPTREQAGRRLL